LSRWLLSFPRWPSRKSQRERAQVLPGSLKAGLCSPKAMPQARR
jgi:hypothetical protein